MNNLHHLSALGCGVTIISHFYLLIKHSSFHLTHSQKAFVISKKSINFASHLTGSRPVKNFFNKLTAVFY